MTIFELSQDCKDFVQAEIDAFIENIDKEIFLQIKTTLNNYFGETHNQIVKPTVEEALKYMRRNWSHVNLARLKELDEPMKTALWKSFKVYVKFDHVRITNGRRGTYHDIKDLWVRFGLGAKGSIHNLSGARSTFNFKEARAGYVHSHLNIVEFRKDTPPGFQGFCLGTGEINQVIMFLNTEGFDPINFTLFCLHLKNYVEWESLDGGPFMYYEEIGKYGNSVPISNTRSPASLSSHNLKRCVDLLKLKLVTTHDIDALRPLIDVFILENTCTITESTEQSIMLANIIRGFSTTELDRIGVNRNDLLAKKDMDGRFIHPEQNQQQTTVIEPTKPLFEFKGEPVYVKIEGLNEILNNNDTQNTDQNVYTNPQIIAAFCKSFSEDFAEACFRNQKAIKTNTLKNLFQTTGPNLLALR